jgi:hypothetical protein
MGRAFIVCTCGAVYERRAVVGARDERGSFNCACGRELGAWSGITALRYRPIENPSPLVLAHARQVSHSA